MGCSRRGNDLLLTVITPCLNAVDTIGDTLSSISQLSRLLEEQGLSLEHLVIDGGSQDGTLELLNEYRYQHDYCTLIKGISGGPYAAMNVGLAAAKAHFTHILNADDLIWDLPGYVALLQRGLGCKAQLLLASIVYFRRPDWSIRSVWTVDCPPAKSGEWHRQLLRGLHYPHPGFIARTPLYRDHGFDLRFSLSADYHLMQKLMLQVKCVDEVCCSEVPLVAMAEGGVTSSWRAVLAGFFQLRAINRELGIQSPAGLRYLAKARKRYLARWARVRPERHRG
jgi:glycosyltransferase involved in cell wall biosynthesis